jgi:cysteinyl-tRNA synthetase
MLRLFNTMGKKIETFRPVRQKVVTMFTCGPSVYQQAHIGNFRTFLFEDILVRYLAFRGYEVCRGMNFTDVEDKAINEAQNRGMSVRDVTDEHIETFLQDMDMLGIVRPDYLPRASEAVDEAVQLIEVLLRKEVAYWHRGNVYFDPLKYKGFGRIYGLDMSKWPGAKKRFHKDTYPGMRWNLGDFILWHGYNEGDLLFWDTSIGRGRPSWNIEDPAMIGKHFDETLSIYCGGIDNLVRHHDYTLAILESVRPYPAVRYWLHCQHLHVNGKKMSKSRGNIYTVDFLKKDGYSPAEIRFFLTYGHYRKNLNYSSGRMADTVSKLRDFQGLVRGMSKRAEAARERDQQTFRRVNRLFMDRMDEDLDMKGAFDGVHGLMAKMDARSVKPEQAAGMIEALRGMDEVWKVIF